MGDEERRGESLDKWPKGLGIFNPEKRLLR